MDHDKAEVMTTTPSTESQQASSRMVSLPWLKSTEGYTFEVEDSNGAAVWATAIALQRRQKAPRFIGSKDGTKRAYFHRMERTCLIYRQANDMKILKQVARTERIEIGNLDGRLRLPTAGRSARGMKTKCDACGEEITDEFFIGGFKTAQPNLKLHERCAPDAERPKLSDPAHEEVRMKPRREGRVRCSAWLDRWPGNWKPGDKVEATGTPHHGERGEVIAWQSKWGSPRVELVPVFLPKYPNTFFWWFGPNNLKRSNEKLTHEAGGERL